MREERSSSILLPFIVGVAAGAALGILLAPQSGKRTRKQLRRKAEALRDRAVEMAGNGREVYAAATERLSDIRQAKRDDLDDVARFLMEEGMHLWERVTTEDEDDDDDNHDRP
ncbi:MAG TPA: YtxH domain-containing protein [Flavobacteriales bacterium]